MNRSQPGGQVASLRESTCNRPLGHQGPPAPQLDAGEGDEEEEEEEPAPICRVGSRTIKLEQQQQSGDSQQQHRQAQTVVRRVDDVAAPSPVEIVVVVEVDSRRHRQVGTVSKVVASTIVVVIARRKILLRYSGGQARMGTLLSKATYYYYYYRAPLTQRDGIGRVAARGTRSEIHRTAVVTLFEGTASDGRQRRHDAEQHEHTVLAPPTATSERRSHGQHAAATVYGDSDRQEDPGRD